MIEQNSERTELENLGEFGLIDHLTKDLENKQATTKIGVGDDAAVIDAGDKYLLVSTDMLMEGVHFDLSYAPLKHLGYKSVIVNLSDIYAMNGKATQITISIAVSNRFSLEAIDAFYEGAKLAAEIYGVDIIGGDTTSSLAGFCISITAIGEVEKDKLATRSGAQENDLICVTGDLGAAYVGLQLLEREKSIFKEDDKVQPDFSGKDYLLERQLKPEAKKGLKKMLENAGVVPTSMIDVSDGLASELMHLGKNSDKGMTIYEDKLPIDPLTVSTSEELGLDPTISALNGGEDYELLFTVKQADFEHVKALDGVSIIGHVTELSTGFNMVGKGENIIKLTAQGWDAFTN
ncbi:thiamine-phosphate kinase [Salibacteraceae bacterium]|nr:thiamine-phosphate kinase [Salibacteraceae bacterium]